jgi:hypothetical protein
MKIALVGSLCFPPHTHPDLVKTYKLCLETLFRSAKKYFLLNHEIDLLLITNTDDLKLDLDYVKRIKIDYDVYNNWHGYAMKVLSLGYIPKEYDYIFNVDVDSIFVNEVKDEDLLTNDFVVMKHWMNTTFTDVLKTVTDCITVDFDSDNETWVMGNFFGGKSEKIYELFKESTQIHNDLFGKIVREDCHFYSRYPEELFIGKYVNENKVDYKYLEGCMAFSEVPSRNFFLGDCEFLYREFLKSNSDEALFPSTDNVQLLHNTKSNLEMLSIFSKKHM